MRLHHTPCSTPTPPDEPTLHRDLTHAGLDVLRWHDDPGAHYRPHSHDHDETICLITGEITFTIDNRAYTLRPGDRLTLPAGTVHAAEAGPAGATYLIGQDRA